MGKFFLLTWCTFALWQNSMAQEVDLAIKTNLFDFNIKAPVFTQKKSKKTKKRRKAYMKLVKGEYRAPTLVVPLKKMETGLDMRNTHTMERLGYPKERYVFIKNFRGDPEKLSATATIVANGIEKKDVEGTLEREGKRMCIHFSLSMADFRITGVKHLLAEVKDKVKGKACLRLKKSKSS